MVTPKVNETKRGSAHKAAGAGTPASSDLACAGGGVCVDCAGGVVWAGCVVWAGAWVVA